jgi:hypothetical protein
LIVGNESKQAGWRRYFPELERAQVLELWAITLVIVVLIVAGVFTRYERFGDAVLLVGADWYLAYLVFRRNAIKRRDRAS